MDYQETNREDFNAENIQCDEIPVATVTDEEANRLIPADAAADDENYLMITFGKPYDFEGETFKGIDLSGQILEKFSRKARCRCRCDLCVCGCSFRHG